MVNKLLNKKSKSGDLVSDRVLLDVRTSRTGEETPESMVQFLASIASLKRLILPFWGLGVPISLELGVIDQAIHFFVSVPSKYQTFIEGQIVAVYPKALITKVKDYLPEVLGLKVLDFSSSENLARSRVLDHGSSESGIPRTKTQDPASKNTLYVGQMKLTADPLYPIRTFTEFKDVDSLASVLGLLSKSQPTDKISIQFLLRPIDNGWQAKGERAAGKRADAAGVEHANPYSKVIMEKIAANGFKTAIRIAVNSETPERSEHLIRQIANSFSSYNNPTGNSLIFRRVFLWQRERLIKAMLKRSRFFMPRQIFNIQEIATMFHFPTDKLAKIHNISWHKTILSEPPEKLPISEGLSTDEKSEINFFARTEFKNRMTTFGIKASDRRRHMYIIGKTGTGKSTLIANLAISDIRNRKGMCIIDPHGDLCETILDYIPSYRINDVIYLDPSDLTHAFSLNPIEVTDSYQMELVVSGIVATFHKIYGESWGPRLEYILRNTLMTVVRLPNPTLLMVPEMLTNEAFRKNAMTHIDDAILKSFWENEFANMTDKLRAESISPILNKVGQFISSRFIRNIIQNPKSTIDIEKIMNEGKILLLNLSQGRLGEDNSALLGAMFITKIQLAAMNRVSLAEKDRRDFYLYVDEFQNFATTSFIKILSEARKYRLNLILANQYISQIPQEVRGAIFGNAGTMASFLVGAEDAGYMAREFTERFKEEDLLALGNYQAIVKLAIDSITQAPFLAYTLPLPQSVTQNREKVIQNSRTRYMKKVEG